MEPKIKRGEWRGGMECKIKRGGKIKRGKWRGGMEPKMKRGKWRGGMEPKMKREEWREGMEPKIKRGKWRGGMEPREWNPKLREVRMEPTQNKRGETGTPRGEKWNRFLPSEQLIRVTLKIPHWLFAIALTSSKETALLCNHGENPAVSC